MPFAIMLIASIVMHNTPFGNHNLALTDGKFYLNGLLFNARLFKGQENFLYSFTGLGNNEWAALSWGDFNPVKLLGLFATLDTVPSWFTWISIVNMAVCGLTMYCMLSGLYGHKASHLLFSTSYAMMGFNVANCFQMLFFIGPQMLPLMVLGLVRLLRGKSPLLYILSLFFCVFCNFYFGLMLCVASGIIFIVYNYVYSQELVGKRSGLCKIYLISSAIAGLMASFFWLPALKAFSGGGRLDQTTAAEYQFVENMPFIQIFSKLFTGANSALEEVQGLPNIFCGILVVALVVLFFMNQSISKRLKRGTAAVLVLYLLTFYIRAFTLAMHGFTHTNWFPYRYSYVFSFFLIWIAAVEFGHIGELGLSEAKRCFVVILLAAIIVFSTSYEFISGGEVLIDFAILALIELLFYRWKSKPETFKKRVGAVTLMLLVSCNLFANYILSIQKLQRTDNWELNLETYAGNTVLSGGLIDGIMGYDNSFFRMEKDFSESDSVGADPALYDYNGVSASGPHIRMFVHKQLGRLGINWFDMRHWYSKGIPAATDALLGLRYLLSDKDLTTEKGYEGLIKLGDAHIYKNPYELSIAILAEEEAQNVELGNDVFENLNQVWRSMTGGNKDIFTEEENVTFTLHNQSEGRTVTSRELAVSVSKSISESESVSISNSTLSEVSTEPSTGVSKEEPKVAYIECKFTAIQDGPVYYFDTSVPASPQGRSVPAIEFVGMYEKGDEVVHYFTVGDDITGEKMKEYASALRYAYADNEILAEYATLLNSRDCTFTVVHENDLTGEFTAEERQRILFTIPWDEGWTCYIDGQKVPIDKTWDLFMSVEVPAGHHAYEMKFFPAWMNYGLILCGAALLGLVILMVVWKKRKPADEVIPQLTEEKATEAEVFISEGSV